jgi:hypothetical protein
MMWDGYIFSCLKKNFLTQEDDLYRHNEDESCPQSQEDESCLCLITQESCPNQESCLSQQSERVSLKKKLRKTQE